MMFLSVFAAVVMAAQSAPSSSTEMLGMDAPASFQIVNHRRNDKVELTELVEPPDTAENWSKILTIMVFFGIPQTGLDKFESQWHDVLRGGCPAMTVTVVQGSVDSHRALLSRLSCPRSAQTGEPDNISAVLVLGDANLMMAQMTFHHELKRADTALIDHIVGSLKVCDQRTIISCTARKAAGFVAAP
jgi:hypothetical protein